MDNVKDLKSQDRKNENSQFPQEDESLQNNIKGKFNKGSKWYSIINIEPRGTTVFFRQLATLIGAGMPLLESLRTISRNDQYGISPVVNVIANDVEQGNSLSSALEKFPKIFPKMYINLLVIAEKGGSLEETLKGLANFTESEDITRNQIKRALLYPLITLLLAVVVFSFVLAYVIPSFFSTLLGSNADLNTMTKVIFFVSIFFRGYWWALLLGAIAVGFGIYFSNQTPGGKVFWDRFKLNMPVLGTILKKIAIMNITRSFGILIKNGVPILKSIKLLYVHTENHVYAEVLKKAHDEVEKGNKFYESIAQSKMFPPFVVDLVTIGESSGKLDDMMTKIADSYHDEVEQITNNLSTLVEPILLLVIGTFTGIIVYSVFSTYIHTLKAFT